MKEAANAIININDDPMHGRSANRNTHIGLAMEMSFLDAMKRSRLPQVRKPDNMNITMFSYQKQSFGAMLQSRNGILADEMGIGKTLPAIAYVLEHTRMRRENKTAHGRILLVLPAGLMAKWKEDLSNAFGPGIVNIVWGHAFVEGGFRVREVPQEFADMADVLVISYSGLVTE